MTANATEQAGPVATDVGRRTAILLLLLIMLAGLGLRVWGFRVGLPRVFQTDYHQLNEAVSLLRTGSFQDNGTYPTTLVYGYAAGGVALYALGRLSAPPAWTDWDGFQQRLADNSFAHSFGRIWSALVDTLAILGVYLLARVCFGRRIALLAAALVACSPINVMLAHQVRIHTPTSTLAVYAAVPFLRQMQGTARRRGLVLAGAAAGFVASCFQLGHLLLLAEGLTLLVLVRPLRRALADALSFTAGAVVAVLFGMALARLPGVVIPGGGRAVIGEVVSSGSFVFGMNHPFSDLWRLPRQYAMWFLSVPVAAALALVYAAGAVRSRARARTALLYLAYPLVGVTALAFVQGDRARFTLPLAVFAAPLAAAACLSIARPVLRRVLLVLLIGVPLVTCLRYDSLLTRADTRDVMEAMLPRLGRPEAPVLVDARLLLTKRALPAGVTDFPPGQDYRPWFRKQTTARRTLVDAGAAVFIRPRDLPAQTGVYDHELELLGYERYGALESASVAMLARAGMGSLPDLPSAPVIDVWTTWRLGPSIDFWVRGENARRTLERIASPEDLPRYGM